MKQIWIKKTAPEETREAFDWLGGIANRNLIDWDVLTYPATTLLKATNGDKNILHVPVQTVHMVESLGIGPESTELETAKALQALMQTVHWESSKAGHGEIYFLCRDEQTVKFAEHNGMERVDIPLFRMKVSK